MKNTKKLLSILLMLTLLLALGSQAFAADGTITIMNPGTEDYKAYKIFDITDDGSGNPIYTISTGTGSEWLSILVNPSNPGNTKYPSLTFTPEGDKYTVSRDNTFSAADFAVFLRGSTDANLSGKTGKDFSVTPVTATVAPGYYLVISADTNGNQQKASLTSVLDGQNVSIQNKNDMPFDKEVDGVKEKPVEIGKRVAYTLTGKVPSDINGQTSYTYLVSDTMDEGLTFDGPVVVTIDSNNVTLDTVTDPSALLTGNQIRIGANDKTFELSLNLIGKNANAPIVITYHAIINENAATTVSKNKAVLEYGNDPSILTVKDSETKVYNSRILVDKFETNAPEQKLAGAEFVLYKVDGGNYSYYRYNEDTDKVSWVETTFDSAKAEEHLNSINSADQFTKVITATDGAAEFKGLENGTYYLQEIKAPAGYTLLTTDTKIDIDGSGATAVGLTDALITQALTIVANVANTPGTVMPSTGGIGTTIFYLVGSVLIFGAAIVLILRKRSEA